MQGYTWLRQEDSTDNVDAGQQALEDVYYLGNFMGRELALPVPADTAGTHSEQQQTVKDFDQIFSLQLLLARYKVMVKQVQQKEAELGKLQNDLLQHWNRMADMQAQAQEAQQAVSELQSQLSQMNSDKQAVAQRVQTLEHLVGQGIKDQVRASRRQAGLDDCNLEGSIVDRAMKNSRFASTARQSTAPALHHTPGLLLQPPSAAAAAAAGPSAGSSSSTNPVAMDINTHPGPSI